tara:strand:+ start:172 stop:486 length:315 start_codon:yes stop_codon:yes gene_type:complete
MSIPYVQECPMCARLIALAQIRARRDEVGRHGRIFGSTSDFWRLFDDDAEFGPDKPEPTVRLVEKVIGDDVNVRVHLDGAAPTFVISQVAFSAIKKLGAEEAKE